MALGPPAFQFYAGDFLVSTITMSNAEVGAYVRLLCHEWVNGGIPTSLKLVSKIVHENVPRTRRLMDRIRARFVLDHNGDLRNVRLEAIRAKAVHFSAVQSAKGKQGGRPRKKPGLNPRGRKPRKAFQSSIFDLRSSVRTRKNAASPRTSRPGKPDRPSVPVLAAMILRDILPRGIADDGDRMELAKRRAAQLKLKYDGRSIASAIASARAQYAKVNGS